MSTVNRTSSSTTSTATDSTELAPSVGSRILSQDDFLNLLVAQMKSQDPMNPQTDTQMAAQMAQFTSLQQSNTMSANIATMLTQQQILQANSMLGGTVTVQADAKTTATGVVQAVEMTDGAPKIVVDGKSYDLSQVLMLTPTVIPEAATTTP
ncbi:MAG: flagellar hook capping FlgD N-terminal domain-containing protein [Verrucomicrobiota bacterium]